MTSSVGQQLLVVLIPVLVGLIVALGALVKAWTDLQTARFTEQLSELKAKADVSLQNQAQLQKLVDGRMSEMVDAIPASVSAAVQSIQVNQAEPEKKRQDGMSSP